MWVLILTFVAWNSGASVSMSEPVFTKESCMLAAKSYVEQTKDSGKRVHALCVQSSVPQQK